MSLIATASNLRGYSVTDNINHFFSLIFPLLAYIAVYHNMMRLTAYFAVIIMPCSLEPLNPWPLEP